MPLFSLQLNEMTPGLEAKLPPTDVRRRWDLRALEQGDYAKVTNHYVTCFSCHEARCVCRQAAVKGCPYLTP